nr:reverse transcriptase domain-containing protein [Tanacetum cinerariifolium]
MYEHFFRNLGKKTKEKLRESRTPLLGFYKEVNYPIGVISLNVTMGEPDEQPIQDLALNVDNVFQADDCDVFDSNVDEAPTTQTMFMANLSSADLVTDEAGPSYD